MKEFTRIGLVVAAVIGGTGVVLAEEPVYAGVKLYHPSGTGFVSHTTVLGTESRLVVTNQTVLVVTVPTNYLSRLSVATTTGPASDVLTVTALEGEGSSGWTHVCCFTTTIFVGTECHYDAEDEECK